MMAAVGQDAPFEHGREQIKLLAGLSVTTKAVERTAEAIGVDIAARQQEETNRARQLDLPIPIGPSIPVLYVELDGTGVPVVRAETEGRPGKIDGQPAHTREVKLGCVFTQTTCDQEGFAVRDPDSTTYTGAIESAEEFGKRLYAEARWQAWMRQKQPRLLVIWGKFESSFDPSEPESYRRDVPNAEVHIVDGGHFTLDTAADEIAALVSQFIKTQK
jgi:pimeloyl-ACP methyl ester carboxylesterase